MNKTYGEIVGNKKYHELTTDEKVALNARVDFLASNYAGEGEVFDELYAALSPFIRALSYRYAERSYSVEREEFEGIINLTLVESLLSYDSSKGVPFQPFFAMNVRNDVKMLYRSKSKDMHDTTYSSLACRLDADLQDGSGDRAEVASQSNDVDNAFWRVLAEELIAGCYGDDELKRTVVMMYLDGFRLREIANAVNTESKKFQTIEKFVQRTVKGFKEYAIALT